MAGIKASSLEQRQVNRCIPGVKGELGKHLARDQSLQWMLRPVYINYRFTPRLKPLFQTIAFNSSDYSITHKKVKQAIEKRLKDLNIKTTRETVKLIQFLPLAVQLNIEGMDNRWIVQVDTNQVFRALIRYGLQFDRRFIVLRDYALLQEIEIEIWKILNEQRQREVVATSAGERGEGDGRRDDVEEENYPEDQNQMIITNGCDDPLTMGDNTIITMVSENIIPISSTCSTSPHPDASIAKQASVTRFKNTDKKLSAPVVKFAERRSSNLHNAGVATPTAKPKSSPGFSSHHRNSINSETADSQNTTHSAVASSGNSGSGIHTNRRESIFPRRESVHRRESLFHRDSFQQNSNLRKHSICSSNTSQIGFSSSTGMNGGLGCVGVNKDKSLRTQVSSSSIRSKDSSSSRDKMFAKVFESHIYKDFQIDSTVSLSTESKEKTIQERVISSATNTSIEPVTTTKAINLEDPVLSALGNRNVVMKRFHESLKTANIKKRDIYCDEEDDFYEADGQKTEEEPDDLEENFKDDVNEGEKAVEYAQISEEEESEDDEPMKYLLCPFPNLDYEKAFRINIAPFFNIKSD